MNILAGGLSLLVLGINFYFAAVYIQNLAIKHWALYTFIALVMIAYVAFILYLVSMAFLVPVAIIDNVLMLVY